MSADMERRFTLADPAAVNAALVEAAPKLRALVADVAGKIGSDSRAILLISTATALLALAGQAYRQSCPTASKREGAELVLGLLMANIDGSKPAAPLVLNVERQATNKALSLLIPQLMTLLTSGLRRDDLGALYLGATEIIVGEAAFAITTKRPTLSRSTVLGAIMAMITKELLPNE